MDDKDEKKSVEFSSNNAVRTIVSRDLIIRKRIIDSSLIETIQKHQITPSFPRLAVVVVAAAAGCCCCCALLKLIIVSL
jgi:hypothetical protein